LPFFTWNAAAATAKTTGILHGDRHFEKNRSRRSNFYIIFCYSDTTIDLLEFYFILILSFLRSALLISVSSNPAPLSLSLSPEEYASTSSRWETINLEYPACWKRTEWKIFPFTVMFREFFPSSREWGCIPGRVLEYRTALFNLRPLKCRAFRKVYY